LYLAIGYAIINTSGRKYRPREEPMAQSFDYVAARDIKVGDVLEHPYTTWTITKVRANEAIDHYSFEATPSNPSYERLLSAFGDAMFQRRK
jgi:hypothetical protein